MQANNAALQSRAASVLGRFDELLEEVEATLVAMDDELRLVLEIVIKRALGRAEHLANLVERRAVDSLPVEETRGDHRDLVHFHRLRVSLVEHIGRPEAERLD